MGALPMTAGDGETFELEFRRFFERHHRDLARLAYLMLGDPDSADDLAADALAAAWDRWDRVRRSRHPLAYVRRIVLNMCHSRIRSLVRERDRLAEFGMTVREHADGPDVPAVLDVRAALQRLPERKRACVVLRFGFDLSEKETARVLGVTVGTVKSQTSKGIAELQRALGDRPPGARRPETGDPERDQGRDAGRDAGRDPGRRPPQDDQDADRRPANGHPGRRAPGRGRPGRTRRGAADLFSGAIRPGERPQEGT
ncbi:SigE family RNA polymerase sigma factor [Actinomadura viridis]|uniref:SigE family RNA polymerase sigma factor n=1 Tax=Actinomadura viridis TaxID=58110 RepID=UPI0036CCD926